MENQSVRAATTAGGASGQAVNLEAGRRAFLRSAGLGAAALAAFGASMGGASAPAQAADRDVQVLNFALNLEYLEAEFYLQAVYGENLQLSDTRGTGTMGGVSGGRKVQFATKVISNYASEVAKDEITHVRFLRSALGSAAIARPAIDIGTSFTTAARAAGLISSSETFDAYANENNFLLAAYIFEDVGVTAYRGAAPLITNKDYLSAAAGILAVEAYHASLIRSLLYSRGFLKQTELISNLRNKLDGDTQSKDQGVGGDQSTRAGGPSTSVNIVPTNKNAMAFSRTPRAVLNIVQGKQNATKGLFFPNGADTPFNVAAAS